MRRLVLLGAALAAIGLSAGPASASVQRAVEHTVAGPPNASVSSNWSGYSISAPGTSFTDVKWSWVQPAATCTARKAAYSSFWVGLGGSAEGAQGLEQIGTSADCQANGRTSTYAWYELIPAPAVVLPLTISPGDVITAEVSVTGATASFQLTDTTTGATYASQQPIVSLDLSSAEWIAEAPAQCGATLGKTCTVLPLADFGSVLFTSASATVNGYTGPISDPTWSSTSIALGSAAVPSTLSPDGTSFSVDWRGTGVMADYKKPAAKPKVTPKVKAKPKPKR
jgi:hypothetical protein